MPNQTDNSYRVEGRFNPDTKIANLGLYILPETANKYICEPVFNISKSTDNGQINAVLVFLSREDNTDAEFGYNVATYPKRLYLDRLPEGMSTTVNIDYDLEDMFIIVFHDNSYHKNYIKYFYDELEKYLQEAQGGGDGTFTIDREIPDLTGSEPIRPRTAGMTIIKSIKPR